MVSGWKGTACLQVARWPSRHIFLSPSSCHKLARRASATHRPARRHSLAACACAVLGALCGWPFGIVPCWVWMLEIYWLTSGVERGKGRTEDGNPGCCIFGFLEYGDRFVDDTCVCSCSLCQLHAWLRDDGERKTYYFQAKSRERQSTGRTKPCNQKTALG